MKVLTRENWLEMDPVCGHFLTLDIDKYETAQLFPEHWLDVVLKPTLNTSVPNELKGLFEVARAVMLYGYLFYPLFELGRQQFYRVAEAAVTLKYESLGGPVSKPNGKKPDFSFRISWLKRNKHISKLDADEWHWVRNNRNLGSHLRDVSLYPPLPSAMALEETADRINRLFS